jgi:hypothetical protein
MNAHVTHRSTATVLIAIVISGPWSTIKIATTWDTKGRGLIGQYGLILEYGPIHQIIRYGSSVQIWGVTAQFYAALTVRRAHVQGPTLRLIVGAKLHHGAGSPPTSAF